MRTHTIRKHDETSSWVARRYCSWQSPYTSCTRQIRIIQIWSIRSSMPQLHLYLPHTRHFSASRTEHDAIRIRPCRCTPYLTIPRSADALCPLPCRGPLALLPTLSIHHVHKTSSPPHHYSPPGTLSLPLRIRSVYSRFLESPRRFSECEMFMLHP